MYGLLASTFMHQCGSNSVAIYIIVNQLVRSFIYKTNDFSNNGLQLIPSHSSSLQTLSVCALFLKASGKLNWLWTKTFWAPGSFVSQWVGQMTQLILPNGCYRAMAVPQGSTQTVLASKSKWNRSLPGVSLAQTPGTQPGFQLDQPRIPGHQSKSPTSNQRCTKCDMLQLGC